MLSNDAPAEQQADAVGGYLRKGKRRFAHANALSL
jgi:hypothetical protein